MIGFERARGFGEWLGELQFRVAWIARRRQTREMAAVLGRPADDPSARDMMRTAYRVNNAAVIEVLAMFEQRQDPQQLAARCEIEGIGQLQAALALGRGAILLGAHMGNGLLVPVQLASSGWPVSVVYRHARMMSSGLFEQGLALYGIEPILANEGIKAYGRMLGALRKGRVLFLMMDQGVKQAEDGVPMRFLGKDMPMTAGPAQLARHSRAPVLPVATTEIYTTYDTLSLPDALPIWILVLGPGGWGGRMSAISAVPADCARLRLTPMPPAATADRRGEGQVSSAASGNLRQRR
jgi:KDO2-lipid IV(A) lauroyltransferase